MNTKDCLAGPKSASGRFFAGALFLMSALAVAIAPAEMALAQINEATTQPPESPKPRFPQLPDDNVDVPRNDVPGAPDTIVAPKENEFVGKLEKVDGQALTFKENDAAKLNAAVKTVTAAPNAKVTLNRQPAKLADLKPGDFVRIMTPPGDAKVAIEVAAARVIHDTPPQPDPMAQPTVRTPRNTREPLPGQQGGLGLVVSDSPQNGVLILHVKRGTPAWDAGIQTGDYLLELSGQEIVTPEDFLATVRQHAPRESVNVVVWRKGRPRNGDVILTTREAADDREAEDGRALIMAETHGDDTVVIKRTPDRTEVLDREPDQPTVVLDKEPSGTAVVIDRAKVQPIPTDYEELARQYRLLQDRLDQLEQEVNRKKD